MIKLLDSYPASSKIGLIESVSTLKFHIAVKIDSVSIMSKFVSFMIAIIIFDAFKGKLQENRTVNMIICSVLIKPQRNWSTPIMKNERKKFVPIKTDRKPPAAPSTDSIAIS